LNRRPGDGADYAALRVERQLAHREGDRDGPVRPHRGGFHLRGDAGNRGRAGDPVSAGGRLHQRVERQQLGFGDLVVAQFAHAPKHGLGLIVVETAADEDGGGWWDVVRRELGARREGWAVIVGFVDRGVVLEEQAPGELVALQDEEIRRRLAGGGELLTGLHHEVLDAHGRQRLTFNIENELAVLGEESIELALALG
jgi:hypothetical protein